MHRNVPRQIAKLAEEHTHTNTDIRVLPRCSVERSRVFTLVQGFVQKYARRVCKVGNVHARFLSPRDRNIAWLRDDIGWAAVAGGHFISRQPYIWLMFFSVSTTTGTRSLLSISVSIRCQDACFEERKQVRRNWHVFQDAHPYCPAVAWRKERQTYR